MTYKNLRIQGTLTEVKSPTLVQRVSNDDLISPERVHLTRVRIDGEQGSSTHTEIFGIVPLDYIGKPVELVQSYHKLKYSKLFLQSLYVEGECVLNVPIVRKY
jgi:hypothetical protein